MPIKIAYYGNCWMTNLGESFIDIGAMELLRQAMPDSEVIFVTPMSHYYNNAMRLKSGKLFSSKEKCLKKAANLGLYIKADVLVMSGMFATEEFLRTGSSSYWLSDYFKANPEVKVMFMGIGGQKYDNNEMESFLNYINSNINLKGFISRDNKTFSMYDEKIDRCYPGIDCAFYVSESYKCSGFSSKDYIVSTFSNMKEPEFIKNIYSDIIRPQHMFYSAKYDESIDNIFISDSPYDYLSLYANAKEVHTDLVHATIVGLAYGKKVKYYHDSKRSLSFEAAGALKDENGYLYLDNVDFIKKKNNMKNLVRRILLS